jgi:trehalose 6-phosphate synthase
MQTGAQPPLLSPITQEDLGQLQVHLPALKIISFRGPGHSGGVVASLSPLTKQLGTQVHWIALTGVPTSENNDAAGFSFHRADVSSQYSDNQMRAIYDYLWPLLHGLDSKAQFDMDAWRSFRQLSQTVAQQSFRVSMRSYPHLVWVHDFEMALVPSLLPTDAGVVLCHFFHAPWPDASVMAASPIGKELVESLLHNRVLGFHTKEYARTFLESVRVLVPGANVNMSASQVTYKGQETRVVAMPLGIDFQFWQRLSRTAKVDAESLPIQYRLAQQVLLGVDRLDYTKGLLEKLDGLELFLSEHSDWLRRFHYVQLAQPCEIRTDAFEQYRQQVKQKIDSINLRFGVDGWQPIIYIEGQMSAQQLAAWYQAADALLVTPVRDGLNLIAKEFVACRVDEQGAVIVSKQAGVAYELMGGALFVEPSSPESIADAILRAMTMPVEEKRRRMLSMRHVVGWNRLHDWACGFLHLSINTAFEPLMHAG